MSRFSSSAKLSVIAFGVMVAGCGDGQQSGFATRLKSLLGGETANPTVVAERDSQQARQNKLNELLKKAEAGDVAAMVELGRTYMAKPWHEVVRSSAYQALPPDEKKVTQQQYFDDVIAPQFSPDKLAASIQSRCRAIHARYGQTWHRRRSGQGRLG